MNIRVQPTVRCLYVPEENALKLILKEDINADASSSKAKTSSPKASEAKQELVIYVLKVNHS